MQSISQVALAASIFASVMGALVMCVLVFRYGFTVPAPSDAEGGPTPTDVLMTRVGHAVAGVCFAATAVFAIVALSVRTSERPAPAATAVVAPTPATVVAATEPTSEMRASRVERDVEALQRRLDEAESQLARLDAETRSTSSTRAALEPKPPVTRAAALEPKHPVVRTPAATSAVAPILPAPQVADPVPSAPTAATAPTAPEDRFAAFSAPTPPRAAGRSGELPATAREEWNVGRQRAAGLLEDIRAAMTRAERTVVRHLGSDPQGRVSARD